MSLINNDKKVLENKRKVILSAEDQVPLKDRIVEKLMASLNEDGVGAKVTNMWMRAQAHRAPWLERQQEFLASWDQHLEGEISGAFDQSSNLHLPMPMIIAKTMHARFMQALLTDPPFTLRPRTEASVDKLGTISDTLRYAIHEWMNGNKGMEKVVDKWLWAWITQGSGVIKSGWDRRYTKYVDVVTAIEEDVPLVEIDGNGQEVLVPRTKTVEKESEVVRKTFDGPAAVFRELEDLVIIGGDGDPDEADAVIDSDYVTSSDLWTLVDTKVLNEQVVKEIIEGGSDNITNTQEGQIKQDRSINAGKSVLDSDIDHDRYQVLEAHMKYDVDGSGIFSDIIVWVHKRTSKIMRATYLRRVMKSGERPFHKIDFHLRNGQENGVGIIELTYPLCKELDAMHNMRVDFGMLSTMPFGFYRASSSLNPETIQLEPGALIPVDNPATDVFFPNLGNRTVFGFQEEASLMEMINRLTSISDLNMGVQSGQGVARTATGTRALVGESSANLDVYLRRLNRGWRRFLEYQLHQLQQRIEPGMAFRVTGDDGSNYWRNIKDEKDLEGDYDVEVSPNTSSSNKQVQQELAQQILQLTSNPLDIQLQIIGPQHRYEALKGYLQALGVKEYGRYIGKPSGYQGPMLRPEEEANRILRGEEVKVLPDQDHDGFIEFFTYISDNDELLGQFNEQETIALAAQAQKHAKMKQAVAFMQSQAANAAQMRSNASQSAQQAPTALNPMVTGGGAADGSSAAGQA